MVSEAWIYILQVIELDLETLPDGEEVLTILKQEACPLNVWVTLAVSLPTNCYY